MSTARTHIDNKPSLQASHCEDEERSKRKQSQPLVPGLRFNEFDGDYRVVTVNDCIEFLTDYHANGSYERLKENVELLEKEDYAIMIRTTNFEKKNFQNNLLYISEHAYNYLKKSKVLGDDIIINKIANAGATYIMPHLNRPVSLAMNLFMLRTNSNNSGKYIYYKIKTKEFRLRALSSGTGTKTITKQDVKTFKIEIPSLPEQQKIASFLSAVDEKIQQLTKKKALLADYKKGVMQQLFSGQLRFKDENGEAYPDWAEKRIGDLTNVNTGGTPRTMKQEYWGGNIRWMNSGELNLKVVFEVKNRITKEGLKNSATKLIPKKCILIGLAGQGKTRGTAAINMVELCTNQSIASILPNYDRFIPEYLFQNIDQRYSELRGLSTGDGGRGGLNLQIIKSFKVPLPSVKEQQKIANYLSGIDTKIEAVNTQITQTQTFKKGLLQQLFV
jgi:type I restriction enzyme S subunit